MIWPELNSFFTTRGGLTFASDVATNFRTKLANILLAALGFDMVGRASMALCFYTIIYDLHL